MSTSRMKLIERQMRELLGEDTPALLKRCVRAVAKEGDKDVSQAFAICTANLQKHGYLKKGTQELTAKGKKRSQKKKSDDTHKSKMDDYEKLLKRARKGESLTRQELIGIYAERRSDVSDEQYDELTDAIYQRFNVRKSTGNRDILTGTTVESVVRFLEKKFDFYMVDEDEFTDEGWRWVKLAHDDFKIDITISQERGGPIEVKYDTVGY